MKLSFNFSFTFVSFFLLFDGIFPKLLPTCKHISIIYIFIQFMMNTKNKTKKINKTAATITLNHCYACDYQQFSIQHVRLPSKSSLLLFLHSIFKYIINLTITKKWMHIMHSRAIKSYKKRWRPTKSAHQKLRDLRLFGGAHVEKSIIKRVFNTHSMYRCLACWLLLLLLLFTRALHI